VHACNVRTTDANSPLLWVPLALFRVSSIVLTSAVPSPRQSNCWNAYENKKIRTLATNSKSEVLLGCNLLLKYNVQSKDLQTDSNWLSPANKINNMVIFHNMISNKCYIPHFCEASHPGTEWGRPGVIARHFLSHPLWKTIVINRKYVQGYKYQIIFI
jgi:hypothetical protein